VFRRLFLNLFKSRRATRDAPGRRRAGKVYLAKNQPYRHIREALDEVEVIYTLSDGHSRVPPSDSCGCGSGHRCYARRCRGRHERNAR